MPGKGLPVKQGLYRPEFEHDACGIGFVAHIKGKASHGIVESGIEMLCRMDHRAGRASDGETGDGAGILLQIPHEFFRELCLSENIFLPEPGKYAVGMLFMPWDPVERAYYEKRLEEIVASEGQLLLGWRTLPVDDTTIGEQARSCQPFIRQVFIGAGENISDSLEFERKLYVIRKLVEKAAKQRRAEHGEGLYVASLSSRTIVYKGMLTPAQIPAYYLDLNDPRFESAFALVHSRFSTNTFPSWERAHPYRYVIHNGEINTLQGNVNWMSAREKMFRSERFGSDLEKVLPVIDLDGSDSAILDNSLEFLVLSGFSLPHAAMMMVPEPWDQNPHIRDPKKAFYEFHSCLMEPWDGPAAIAFTDGKQIGAILDRNGLRPARYYVTTDDVIIFASEFGVLDVPPEQVACKQRLRPGMMLLVDLEEGRIVPDEEIKERISRERPYREWLNRHMVHLQQLPDGEATPGLDAETLFQRQVAFGYTYEEVTKNLAHMATEGKDPLGAMGYDAPLAVLSNRPQLLFHYFKQHFAQVTNPPIDAIREAIVTSTVSFLGAEGNLLQPDALSCRRIRLETPILSDRELAKLRHNPYPEFKAKTFPILFEAHKGEQELEKALERLFAAVDEAVEAGYRLLILSDREMDRERAAIPSLLAVSGLHHHLIRKGTRTKVSLIVESGEPREVHHFAMLIGYGADAVNPYLAFATLKEMIENRTLEGLAYEDAEARYIKAITDGVVKVMSKMGISTIQSYRGAQIFEAVGIAQAVIDRYFTRTVSQIGGINLETIARETLMRHRQAFHGLAHGDRTLDPGGDLQWRRNGEYHAFNPQTIHTLQQACRRGDYQLYKKYSEMVTREQAAFLRSLFRFKSDRAPVPLEEVEPVESILRRFKTGAMSYGALSQEAHEALAIAMNRIGGKSNSGEGGEDPSRYIPDPNGDLRRSAIKQVASGRFGVTSHYLIHAEEIQIKMAQGAKPGEGGQLPGKKVYPWIAKVRGSTPGVGLISPPPHHDIYSIEDLAQLIYDLKNANPNARISVKLVSKAGVGTIAAGVAKGLADVILISGYEGGTGASPRTSIKHAGLPWELGLAETHQTLVLNHLRDRVVLEADGKLMTGRDVVIAALLGAEEYGFSTAPLVVLGCVMMRVCHMDTCPVGVATQNPELRKKFMGDPEHVVNYMRFVAQEVREIMAQLGFRTINELIGRTDVLTVSETAKSHWKAKDLDLSPILHQPRAGTAIYHQREQDHKLDETLDRKELLKVCEPALEFKKPVEATFAIRNTDRAVGTILGSEVTRRYGEEGLPEDTIRLHFKGSAGQSFGAFVPKGITLTLEGDANDYVGKGLSGGKIIVYPPEASRFAAEENIIIGNVAFYGATSGEAYIRGIAGERFCVRNSGVRAVVEGVGDHGCEYMTGGRVVILGPVGKNFAAGMSGGIAYVLAEDFDQFSRLCNQEMVLLEGLEDAEEIEEVRKMVVSHFRHTFSERAKAVLSRWHEMLPRFVKVIPKDYKRMMEAIRHMKELGLSDEEAVLEAFERNKRNEDLKERGRKVLDPVFS